MLMMAFAFAFLAVFAAISAVERGRVSDWFGVCVYVALIVPSLAMASLVVAAAAL